MDKIGTLLCALAALLAGGCRGRHATGAQPSLRVEVIEAATDTVPNRMSFVSSVESNFDALIEPRVNGYLVNKYFSSGMPVRKGQLLFTIDPNLLSTTLLSAEASLESARAQEVSARNNYERAVPLARIDAISQTQLDQYTAEYVAAQAAVRSAEQQVRNARLQVGYTRIYAPIDGIIASSNAHTGDYVGVGTQFSVLTTISNIDTVAVDVAIPMAQYLRYAGTRPSIYENDGLLSDITLSLADGVVYPSKGWSERHIEFDGNHRAGGQIRQSGLYAQTRTVRPRDGQRRTVAALRRRTAACCDADAGSQFGLGRRARQHGRIPACDARPYCRRPVVHPVGRRAGRMGRYGRYSEVAQRSEGYSDPDQYE